MSGLRKISNNMRYKSRDFRNKLSRKSMPIKGVDYLYGIFPVIAALKSKKRTFYNLYLKYDYGVEKDRKKKLENIVSLWQNETGKLPIDVPVTELNKITKNAVHQGVVLETSEYSAETIVSIEPHMNKLLHPFPLWIALDRIQDSHNLGAIIRSCIFYGVDGIVVTDVNSSPLTPLVSKCSAGAMEIAEIYHPGNLIAFLKKCNDLHYQVLGTSVSADSESIHNLKLDRPTILVLGNEGHGIRHGVLERCTRKIILPAVENTIVDSLNVSVTSGILLSHITNSYKSS